MNLQQLRYLCAVVDHGLNVSDAAEALFTSQPGISKQIRQLEDELGVECSCAQGKRLASLTPAGEIVVATARRALREIANLKRVADEFRSEDEGTLAIATTHTQARYVLPKVLREFADALSRRSRSCCTRAIPSRSPSRRRAATPTSASPPRRWPTIPELVTLPCYEWNRVRARAARRIRSRRSKPLTLEALARYPIVTYDFTLHRPLADQRGVRRRRASTPNVVLTALDSDVIKTYVELGMGVGIVAQMAYDPARDTAFEKLDAAHLFAPSTTRLALRRGVFLRGYVYAFIALFAPALDRAAVDAALAGAEKPDGRTA